MRCLIPRRFPGVGPDRYLSVSTIHTGQVDLRDELNHGGTVWIIVSAVDVQAVDPVLVSALDITLD